MNGGGIRSDAKAARAALRVIHPPPIGSETIEARYLPSVAGGRPIRRFYHTVEALLADAARFIPTHHCYFGVALRSGRIGTAAGVNRAGTGWADIDAKLWAGSSDPKAAAREAILRFRLPPSIVIDSGGGYQPYWLLDEPVNLRTQECATRLELVNAALARAICGPDRIPDHVHDVARVFRLPGTLNHKPEYGTPRPVIVVSFNPERRYGLEELHAALARYFPWALCSPSTAARSSDWSQVGPNASPGGRRERAVRARIRRSTLQLLDSVGPAGYRSASEADAAIAAALIRSGLTHGETFALLSASTRGHDALLRKGERHANAYWRRTVDHAGAYVGSVIDRQDGRRVRRLPLRRRPISVPLHRIRNLETVT